MPSPGSKLDPFDVAALERSLNDSATRVSTIWVSFLIFSLYLLTAATTVSHRQLFLAEPLKLPVLNIDLPLWGFFFLAPILFVILHAYVLMQVLLLARTAAAYNAAVERAGLPPEENALLRQRLANTLFAQIFAGSPREREGWLGFLLKAMVWITLAIAPILIMIAFQFVFLPYHSHLATWTHRLLILVELFAFFLIWPLALDARRDFEWPKVWDRAKRAGALPRRLLGPKDRRRDELLRQQAAPLVACLLFIIVSLSLATSPGEPYVNLFTGQPLFSVQCWRGISSLFDRLDLPGVDVVDDEKLDKIENATKKMGQLSSQGERTQNFRERNLSCGNFIVADLRRVDLNGANMAGVSLNYARLEGASLDGAHLQRATLDNAQLQGASLNSAQLQGAKLYAAKLQGASLILANLQGAYLGGAELQGAFLPLAELLGATFEGTALSGPAQLQGAWLAGANLQGASLNNAQLQGASLHDAHLQGTSLDRTQLQGVDFNGSSMTFSSSSGVFVWNSKKAPCHDSRVRDPKPDAIIASYAVSGRDPESVPASPDAIAKFIERSVADIPDASRKEEARERMRAGLVVDPAKDDTAAIAKVWSECGATSDKPSRQEFDRKFDQDHSEFLRKLVCEDKENGKVVAEGIIRIWISDSDNRRDFSTRLARSLLGLDGKSCPGAKDLDESDKERLRRFASSAPPSHTPAPNQ